jgi:hypothetical protein
MHKFNFSKKKTNPITDVLSNKKTKLDILNNQKFNLSFEDFTSSQKYSSSFKDWQKDSILSYMLDTLKGYCSRPLREQIDGTKFTAYGDFPEQKYTLFAKPNHIPVDAEWARIHINGRSVIIGHIINNTFYIVFLDKTHKFWLTKKDREKYKK